MDIASGPVALLGDKSHPNHRLLVLPDSTRVAYVALKPREEVVSAGLTLRDRIYRVETGKGAMMMAGDCVKLVRGDVVVAPAGVAHALKATGKKRLRLCVIETLAARKQPRLPVVPLALVAERGPRFCVVPISVLAPKALPKLADPKAAPPKSAPNELPNELPAMPDDLPPSPLPEDPAPESFPPETPLTASQPMGAVL